MFIHLYFKSCLNRVSMGRCEFSFSSIINRSTYEPFLQITASAHKALTYDVEVRQTMKLPVSTKQTVRFISVPAGVLETAVELNGSLKYRKGDFILFMQYSGVYKVNMNLMLLFMAYSNRTSAGTPLAVNDEMLP